MFEAKLAEALVLKKIIDAIKDLVTDVNIDATPQGKFLRIIVEYFCELTNLRFLDCLHRLVTVSNGQFTCGPG